MLEISERYAKALNPQRRSPSDAPAWIEAIDNPYLQGLFAPVCAETDVELPVDGTLPAGLNGVYVRNGPNPRFAPRNRYHWFDGDGMVHAVWFEGGKARYANRYVQTPALAKEVEQGEAIWPGVLGPFDFDLPLGPIKDTANTDLVQVGEELLALWYESGRPLALDPRTLQTRGPTRLPLPKRISAHSKTDPATGDFLWFSYGDRPPYMRYGVLRPDGSTHAVDIELPGPRRPHDLGITARYSILHDFPVFFDEALFQRTGKRVPLFQPHVPTRFGVIERFGTTPRWFEFAPCYMLHVVTCYEEGDEVVMIGCRNPDPTLHPRREDGPIAAMLSGLNILGQLHEWRMDLVTGATSERTLDTMNLEFPRVHPGRVGQRCRYAYLQHIPVEIPSTFDALVKVDLQTGAKQIHAYGPGIFGSEAPFVPRPGATAEDDGWLVTFVTDSNDWSSAVWIYDAQHVDAGPVCKLPLPVRVPAGFHATWLDGVPR